MSMRYGAANTVKTKFDDAYAAPTPHAYIRAMAAHGYEIGEQARPYCMAAAALLSDRNPIWPVQVLDVGCSYGIGAAFLKYGCSFHEMIAFFSSRAPREYRAACEATRMWLHATPPVCDVRCVGLDVSDPAVRFARDAGLLDGGIVKDFEQPGAEATQEEIAWFQSCNLLISTGVIGYVTEKTLDIVLEHLGRAYPGEGGPFAVVTILRMFETAPIRAAFLRRGLAFDRVRGARLPQRRFTGDRERDSILALLRDRGVETRGWEERGKLFADLYIAGPEEELPLLLERMMSTHSTPSLTA